MKSAGFILITVLLFLFLISVLVLSQMNMILLQIKELNVQRQYHEVFWEMEDILQSLFEKQPSLWPKKSSFSTKKYQYQLIINAIGRFPCLFIQTNSGFFSSEHWQITLKSHNPKTQLQVRYASIAGREICQDKQLRQVKRGIQSWHYQY